LVGHIIPLCGVLILFWQTARSRSFHLLEPNDLTLRKRLIWIS